MNGFANDAQTLAFVTGQAYKINQTVLTARYPDWNIGELVFVDTSGPEWSPGVWTWTSDWSGVAKWQSAYAKDVPLADVSQDYQLKTFHMAAIGYQWNIEEINTAYMMPGGSLPARRAQAAQAAYRRKLYEVGLTGDTEKGMTGLFNYTGITPSQPANDGTGSARWWVDANGTGTKTPAQIARDINLLLGGVYDNTFGIVPADTLLLPEWAYRYLASTPYSTTTMETVMSFIARTNIYTQMTGRPIMIRSYRELNTAATSTSPGNMAGNGRAVAYRNDPMTVKMHLPMPFRFLDVYRDGPFNYAVPGIFRTGGIELLDPATFAYMDGVSQAPA